MEERVERTSLGVIKFKFEENRKNLEEGDSALRLEMGKIIRKLKGI